LAAGDWETFGKTQLTFIQKQNTGGMKMENTVMMNPYEWGLLWDDQFDENGELLKPPPADCCRAAEELSEALNTAINVFKSMLTIEEAANPDIDRDAVVNYAFWEYWFPVAERPENIEYCSTDTAVRETAWVTFFKSLAQAGYHSSK